MMQYRKSFLNNYWDKFEKRISAVIHQNCSGTKFPKCTLGFSLNIIFIVFVIIGIIILSVGIIIKNTMDEKSWINANNKAKISLAEALKKMSEKSIVSNHYTTEQFVKQLLPEYLQIEKDCNNPKDCGFPEKIKRPDGKEVELKKTMLTLTSPNSVLIPAVFGDDSTGIYSINNKTTEKYDISHFFVTSDGFHVMFFYNPYCVNNAKDRPYFLFYSSAYRDNNPQMSLDTVCYYGVYDMNGIKAPNQVGKDIGFVGSFYNGEASKAVAVLPHDKEVQVLSLNVKNKNYWFAAYNYCNTLNKDKFELPDINELSLIYLNRYLVTDNTKSLFWSRSDVAASFPPPPAYQTVSFNDGKRFWAEFSDRSDISVLCIRKTDDVRKDGNSSINLPI